MTDSESGSSHRSDSFESFSIADEVGEKALRDSARQIHETGIWSDLTLRNIRTAAEKSMNLAAGFFKTNPYWKSKSNDIIKNEVENLERAMEEQDAQSAKSKDNPPPLEDKAEQVPEGPSTGKRATSQSPERENKRQKRSASSGHGKKPASRGSSSKSKGKESQRSPMSIEQSPRPVKSRSSRRVVEETSESEDQNQPAENKTEDDRNKEKGYEEEDKSESEMSDVIDEPPKPKSKGKAPARKAAASKAGPSRGADTDKTDEIKRLQGWLVKCGVRKMWSRELQPFETPKAKIAHLRQMLTDVGMKGRFSIPKAKAIKERRELEEDVEELQNGEKMWGMQQDLDHDDEDADEESSSEGRSESRRVSKGLQSLEFIRDSDIDME